MNIDSTGCFYKFSDVCPKTPDWEKIFETDQVLFDSSSVDQNRIALQRPTLMEIIRRKIL
jgi:hypothetical protein